MYWGAVMSQATYGQQLPPAKGWACWQQYDAESVWRYFSSFCNQNPRP